jgi:hypothetical protein
MDVVKGKEQEFTAMVRDRDEDPALVRVDWFRIDLADKDKCPKTLAEGTRSRRQRALGEKRSEVSAAGRAATATSVCG